MYLEVCASNDGALSETLAGAVRLPRRTVACTADPDRPFPETWQRHDADIVIVRGAG